MFVLEKATAVAVQAFFVREDTFLESQLVVGLHRFDHILHLCTVSADILDSGCSGLPGYKRQVFDTSPPVRYGIGNDIIPLFGSTDTEIDMIVRFLHRRHAFYDRVQDNPVEVVYK